MRYGSLAKILSISSAEYARRECERKLPSIAVARSRASLGSRLVDWPLRLPSNMVSTIASGPEGTILRNGRTPTSGEMLAPPPSSPTTHGPRSEIRGHDGHCTTNVSTCAETSLGSMSVSTPSTYFATALVRSTSKPSVKTRLATP